MRMMKIVSFCLLLIGAFSIKAGTGSSKPVEEFNYNPGWTEQEMTNEILKTKGKIQKMPVQKILDLALEIYDKKLVSEKGENQNEQIQEKSEEEIGYESFKKRMLEGIVATLLDQGKSKNLIEEYLIKIESEDFVKLFLELLNGDAKEFSTIKEEFSKQFAEQVQIVAAVEKKESAKPRDLVAEGLEVVDGLEVKQPQHNPLMDTEIISTSLTNAKNELSDLNEIQAKLIQSREEQQSEIWRINERIENIKLEQSNPMLCSFSEKKLLALQDMKKNIEYQLNQIEESLKELSERIESADQNKAYFSKELRIKLDARNDKIQKLAKDMGKLRGAMQEIEKEQKSLLEKKEATKANERLLIEESFKTGIAAGTFRLESPHS